MPKATRQRVGLLILVGGLLVLIGVASRPRDLAHPALLGARAAATATATPPPVHPALSPSAPGPFAVVPSTFHDANGCRTRYTPRYAPATTVTTTLTSVAALAADDVWAVGYERQGADGPATTLTLHWDGQGWTRVPSPNGGNWVNFLYGVAARSRTDLWAVGAWGEAALHTLALHWDGTSWALVSSPNQGTTNNEWRAVAVTGRSDAWTVGQVNVAEAQFEPLTAHWDGTAWQLVRPGPILTGLNTLNGVAALAPDDVWAVGRDPTAPGIRHWDGHSWTRQSVPTLPLLAELYAVAAVEPADVWAVGDIQGRTLTLHWDGTAWTWLPSPTPSGMGGSLHGVAVTGGTVWAAGSTPEGAALLLQWDGAQWQDRSPIATPGGPAQAALAALPDGTLWTVGTDAAWQWGGPACSAPVAAAPPARLLSSSAVSGALAAGNYILWNDIVPGHGLSGYDLSAGRRFIVRAERVTSFASDGTTVVWRDQGAIGGTDLTTGQPFVVRSAPQAAVDAWPDGLAVWHGVVYYADQIEDADHNLLQGNVIAHDLATGQETVIAPGRAPVVSDDTLLWRDDRDRSLHVRRLGTARPDLVLAPTTHEDFAVYRVSGDHLLWTNGYGPDSTATLYDLPSGQRHVLPLRLYPFNLPALRGNWVAWAGDSSNSQGGMLSDITICEYAIDSGTVTTRPIGRHADFFVDALTEDGGVVYRNGSPYADLYLLPRTPAP